MIANIYMEYFEVEAIATAPTPPKYWDRYVNDTWAVVLKDKLSELFDHITATSGGRNRDYPTL